MMLAQNAVRAAVAAVCLGLVLCAAEAQAFKRKSTVTGPGDRTVTNEATTTRTPGGYTRSATTTGPANQSVNRTSQGQWDPATKTWNNSTTYTGPQGNSADVNRSTTISK
ncbi:hypothetical protein [Solidesulfovibrio magneticus]|uniref:Secreted protein n=1 Tax=Solidesulfovibrio magneticus (strain ATCC 700980 / DSM 13731 / RS-1) TaxID=573370 RepID=C4XJW6_SOLM1|nr:hypothetical protein [Solidesulfovibrio magneticus]BAH74321.1 hypothetical protein DMR_08300 [Solidesulfovibrio magneticus RS-1]